MNGIIWGYDPGGNCNHGLAMLDVRDKQIVAAECWTLDTAQSAISRILGERQPLGIGVDTLTEWSSVKSGWRIADDLLRRNYKGAKSSVASPNSLRGSMVINGMALILAVRNKWPSTVVSETHPKVLCLALSNKAYGKNTLHRRNTALVGWQGIPALTKLPENDDEWDALASAYSLWAGIIGLWPENLHARSRDDDSIVRPAGYTAYFWPKALP